MRYLALFFSIMFVAFAAWQYNDPDPHIWISIYLVCAYTSFMAFRGKPNKALLAVLLALSVAGAIYLFLQITTWQGLGLDDLAMKTNNQELAREAFGLGVCALSFILGLVSSEKAQ
jgi:hypothetical protein